MVSKISRYINEKSLCTHKRVENKPEFYVIRVDTNNQIVVGFSSPELVFIINSV